MPNAPCNFILVLVYANLVQLFLRKPQTDPAIFLNVDKQTWQLFHSPSDVMLVVIVCNLTVGL
jgi:hypothetical protein